MNNKAYFAFMLQQKLWPIKLWLHSEHSHFKIEPQYTEHQNIESRMHTMQVFSASEFYINPPGRENLKVPTLSFAIFPIFNKSSLHFPSSQATSNTEGNNSLW